MEKNRHINRILMKREVNLDDSWQISIDGTEYDDVRLSEFHMPATKRGTEVILKRTLPEETYKQASLRTLVRYSAIQVSIDHDIFFEKGIEEYNNHDILGSGYIWASLPENYAGKELEIRLLTGEKQWSSRVLQNFIPSKNHHSSNESSASTHICIVPSRYNFAYSSGLSMASAFNAQSDPGVVFKSFSASQQSIRSI